MLKLIESASVSKKISWLSGLLLIGLGILGITGYLGAVTLNKNQDELITQMVAERNLTLADQDHDALRAVVFRSIVAAENNQESEKQETLSEIKQYSNDFKAYFDKLDALTLSPETKNAIMNERPLIDDYIAKAQLIVNLAGTGRIKEALVELPEFQKSFKKLERSLDELGKMVEKTGRDSAANSKQAGAFVTSSSFIIMVVALAIGIFFSVYISRTITSLLIQVSGTIVASSSEIASALDEQERITAQQAAAVNQTTITINELSASSRATVLQAEAASTRTQQVLTLVDGSLQMERQNLAGESSLRAKVGQISEQILRLSTQTQQIGSISTLVSELANKTNMLALNAAVEAVRAGEHGKGFSVVASEIRKLAEQSKKSAERINALVIDIQNATNSTVMFANDGIKTVESVVEAVNNIAVNAQEISLTAKQQAVAIAQVLESMNSINQGATQTACGISQTKLGTQKLNEAAQNLKAVV